jgi:hypothetical protein
MNVTIDREKWLAAIANEPDGPCTAVSPEYLAFGRTGERVAALELTFRRVPGATDDELAVRTSLLLRGLSQREAELGGDGLDLDVSGSTFGPVRVILRVFPTKREGAAERVARLVWELNSEGKRVAERAEQDNDGGIGAKIARNLKSPLSESAMKHLEMAAVA